MTLSLSGWQCIPKLSFPGGCLAGCSPGFMNVPKIKGTHNAMKSGMLAAESVWDKIQAGDSETEGVEPADLTSRVKNSWIGEELYALRNVKPAFNKWGLFGGMAYTGGWFESAGTRHRLEQGAVY